VDGQVLVLQDLLGMNKDFKPKFLKTYLDGFDELAAALGKYDSEVKSREFPSEKQSYS
jgi:3-methyl-2-oxobutanoate hydroxymethyltransferase